MERNDLRRLRRAEVVKAMETMVRTINDEDISESWLVVGVADGDIKKDTTLEEIVEMGYTEDGEFKDLLTLFLKLMYKAGVDGLYCDGIVSRTRIIRYE